MNERQSSASSNPCAWRMRSSTPSRRASSSRCPAGSRGASSSPYTRLVRWTRSLIAVHARCKSSSCTSKRSLPCSSRGSSRSDGKFRVFAEQGQPLAVRPSLALGFQPNLDLEQTVICNAEYPPRAEHDHHRRPPRARPSRQRQIAHPPIAIVAIEAPTRNVVIPPMCSLYSAPGTRRMGRAVSGSPLICWTIQASAASGSIPRAAATSATRSLRAFR